MSKLTELLGRVKAGDSEARDAVFSATYQNLHRLAQARLREGGRNTVLDTTCLVHECYLRFVNSGELRAEDRRAFFACAAKVMPSLIVNSARERLSQKPGGDWVSRTLSTAVADDLSGDAETVLKVHEVLEGADSRLGQVAQMRYFGSYSEQEIAETLEITERTVRRAWEKAKITLEAALR
jgi:RNA polymerase sigma factor (TIGR02999 family)